MAEAIDHNGPSSAASVAGSVAKWGLIGAVAAIAATFVAGAVGIAAIAGVFTGGAAFTPVLSAFFSGGMWTWLGGAAAVAVGGAYAGIGAAIGGLFGLAKGGDQVAREKEAHRARVMGLTHNRANSMAQAKGMGELGGLQEGYSIGRADGEQVGFEKGQQAVMQQIQQHMMEQQKQQSAAEMNGRGGGGSFASETPVPAPAMASATAQCTAICGPHTEKVVERREAQTPNMNMAV